MSSQEIQISTSAADIVEDTSNKSICKLCRRQFAKYTCPSCNVPYCSLTCFRSSPHSQCSETFYKDELKSDIATTPSRTTNERKQMMDLLKRFEEEAAADEGTLKKEAFGSSDSEDENEAERDLLVERFAGIDLDTLTSEDMWELLAPAEKEKFMKALGDPLSELTQRLLGSEQLELELEQPWWTKSELEKIHPHDSNGGPKKTGFVPEPIRIPRSLVKPIPHGHPLVYNLCAICIAYSYTIRHLAICALSTLSTTNPDFKEAQRLMNLLVPFLSDRRSTTLHPSVGAAAMDVYSRFEMGKISSELLAVLLEDTAMLMKPQRVVLMSALSSQSSPEEDATLVDTADHPHIMPILVLSDLICFYRFREDQLPSEPRAPGTADQPSPEAQPKKSTPARMHSYQHVVHKLEFYVAHVLATPGGIMEGVTEEALRWSKKVRAESESTGNKGSEGKAETVREPRKQQQLVQEIGQ
ncbi:hypothetical protein P691DRAFT_699277 [Macrolepiota fuliginosa MF-IS2]|uniref:HIT-type domain-containing protein n=1 Tax=Macrolepiota fuliginosa MF-IS2 TaxID=1400762 RepID=A0A9P5XKK5_9AGAR|nr:hypothetical protein P691DRAFT_699277 [Macrolepiota fuliginosa MF-IS2]